MPRESDDVESPVDESCDEIVAETVAEIVDDLTRAAERLNDAAMTVLSRAIEAGAADRPDIERRISRARRTVERAVQQLRGSAEDAGD